MDIVYLFLIGLVTGWLAGVVTRGKGFGFAGNIIIGVVGAMLGKWLMLEIPDFNMARNTFNLVITGVGGSVILLFFMGVLKILFSPKK